MKIKVLGDLLENPSGGYTFPITIGKGKEVVTRRMPFGDATDKEGYYNPENSEPRRVFLGRLWARYVGHHVNPDRWYDSQNASDSLWAFRHKAVCVEGAGGISLQEIILRVKHTVLQEEKALARVQREVEAFENMERVASARRERIPESVRLFVWQRDEGKCVKCGSRERLEFDHIIPIALNGSNTERNIQPLCERCNREKSKNI